MELENKVLSREIQTVLYESGLTIGTAESCTGGKIAEAIIAVPGASEYFKGAIVSYTNEVKERLLGVDHQLLEEKTAVCPEVAEAMVRGAIKTLNVDFAISATGIAEFYNINRNGKIAIKLSEDDGRDKNLVNATCQALQAFLQFVKEKVTLPAHEG